MAHSEFAEIKKYLLGFLTLKYKMKYTYMLHLYHNDNYL